MKTTHYGQEVTNVFPVSVSTFNHNMDYRELLHVHTQLSMCFHAMCSVYRVHDRMSGSWETECM